MKTTAVRDSKGFTLIEMLLVLTIISAIIYAGIGYVQQKTLQTKIDRTSAQMQQILNAGLSYYVANGTWPTDITCLQGGPASAPCNVTYLPPTFTNGWGNDYNATSSNSLFYVYTSVPGSATQANYANSVAQTIAGALPLSYVSADVPPSAPSACDTSGGGGGGGGAPACNVVSMVNIPGQNLNNARAVNFAGLYHHGACVPVPKCPVDAINQTTMTPQVMIVPVMVNGLNDTSTSNTYPISSFAGYAVGPSAPGAAPPKCLSQNATAVSCGTPADPTAQYWRACISVVTEKGDVSITNQGSGTNAWGASETLMAITPCAVTNEPAGSPYTNIYSSQ